MTRNRHGRIRTIEEINEKIKQGSVVAVTAEEMRMIVEEKGPEKAAEEVDVVTTGTFGAMCSSGAFLNFGHSDPPIKMDKITLNGVEAYHGNAAVDCYIGATRMDPKRPFEYGGGHVIEDLVSGKTIHVEAEAYGSLADVGKIISGTRNIRLTYVYFSKLDEILHEEGPESHKIWGAIKEVQTLIHTSLVKGFGVILLSDHSFVKVDKRVNIKAGEAMMASNGGRVIYIYDEKPTLEVSGAGSFDSFTRDRLIMDGWLGWGEYSERIGDTVLVARENGFLTCGGKDSGDKATHGGFLAEEMMAPLALFSPP